MFSVFSFKSKSQRLERRTRSVGRQELFSGQEKSAASPRAEFLRV